MARKLPKSATFSATETNSPHRQESSIQVSLADTSELPVLTSSVGDATTPSPLLADNARRHKADDLLQIADTFVPRLAKVLGNWRGAEGIVLGLYGKWGIGKTSMFNFLREYIDEERKRGDEFRQVFVVDFHPWLYENHSSLVASFFATLAEEVNPSDKGIWKETGRALKTMGKFLAAASGGVSFLGLNVDLSKGLQQVASISGDTGELAALLDRGEQTLREARASIETGLETIGSDGGRIVVLVDDLDRLGADELISMLRLIRVAGDLPHVTLLVALDEIKVRKVLDQAGVGYGEEFLEKIIPTGIHVPYPNDAVFRELVGNQIAGVLEEAGLQAPEWLRERRTLLKFHTTLDELLEDVKTPRDLARLVSSLRLLFLSGPDPDLNPSDALWIEILHVFHPEVYEAVRTNRVLFTHEVYDFFYERKGTQVREERRRKIEDIIQLGREVAASSERIRKIIDMLFGNVETPERPSDLEQQINSAERRIRSPTAFERYFGFARKEGFFSAREVSEMARQITEASRVRHIEAVSTALQNVEELHPNARESLISDLNVQLYGMEPSIASTFGEAVIAVIPRVREETGIRLAWVAFKRIAGPRDHIILDVPERAELLQNFLVHAIEVLPLERAGYFLGSADLTLSHPELVDRARRQWLLRVEKRFAEDGPCLHEDLDCINKRELLLLNVVHHVLFLNTDEARAESIATDREIIAHLGRYPKRFEDLVTSAAEVSRKWHIYEEKANIERIAKTFGSAMVESLIEGLRSADTIGFPKAEIISDLTTYASSSPAAS
jgi:predicted KAP-like P-loop ATPase